VPKGPEPEEFVERVARRIADARQAAGLTQEELAEKLRVSARYVQTVEGGQNVSVHWLARIAGALGIDPSELTIAYPAGEAARPLRRVGRPPSAEDSPPAKRTRKTASRPKR
jgi:transcriptional regulator with XRE-family HTH domain